MSGQKQHVDLHRKVALRRQLIDDAGDGAAWVPYCGDGDLTAELGYDTRPLYAADIDEDRVATFRQRFPDATAVVADCDTGAPFEQLTITEPIAVADLDAYAYPYDAWRAMLEHTTTADRLVVYFTDGQIQSINRAGSWKHPDGSTHDVEKQKNNPTANNYWTRVVKPWIEAEADRLGYHVWRTFKYRRGWMIYWGAVLDRQPQAPDPPGIPDETRSQDVLDALHEAAVSGNVDAALEWLKREGDPASTSTDPVVGPLHGKTPEGPRIYGLHGRLIYDEDLEGPRCTADSRTRLREGAERGSPEARCGNRAIIGLHICRMHGANPEARAKAKMNLLAAVGPAITITVRALEEIQRRIELDQAYFGFVRDETLEMVRRFSRDRRDLLDRTGFPGRSEVDIVDAKDELLRRLLDRRQQTDSQEDDDG